MATLLPQDGNAVAASDVSEQGSANIGDSRVPVPDEQKSEESNARLDDFLLDLDLAVCCVDHVGTVEQKESRSQRVIAVIAAANKLFPGGGDSGTTHGQVVNDQPANLNGVGTQFEK